MKDLQNKDLELLGFQYYPDKACEALHEIENKNQYDIGAIQVYSYLLGVMHGKRAERSKRK